ncbi:hypothetical protein C1I92_17495 [Jiangella anatolica]|uniref:Nuclear transport factor 2 family protein n=1 Tax=Jiangella anatolica TaxID=2670374 RepID=A0A2W2BAQ0_9ACTN|nr:hypothetical protein C1I92_17495 [Jiangella anatolica]
MAVGLCGCSGDDEPAGLATTPPPATTATTATTTPPSADEQDAAAIRDVYAAYWDALIDSENGPDPDPALFDGIATGDVVEAQLARVTNMIDEQQRRIGEPEIGEVQVSVDGDDASAEACVDQRPWGVVVQEQTQPPLEIVTGPIGVRLQREGDGWLIVARIPVAEATISC